MKNPLDQYQPSDTQQQQLESLINIIAASEREGIQAWVFGGYGLDALYGKLTRNHRDIDVFVYERDLDVFREIITQQGYYETPETVGAVGKTVYKNSLFSPEFSLECATVEQGMSIVQAYAPERNRFETLPEQSLGILGGQKVRVPSLGQFITIIEINNQIAEKEGREEYPHREWQHAILGALKKK